MKINVLRYRLISQHDYHCTLSPWLLYENEQDHQKVEISDDQFIAVHELIDLESSPGENSAPALDFQIIRGKNVKYYPFKRNLKHNDSLGRNEISCFFLVVSDTSFQVVVHEMVHGPLFGTPEAQMRSYIAESYKPADYFDDRFAGKYYKMPPMNILRSFLVAV